MAKNKEKISTGAQPPLKYTGLKTAAVSEVAGGIPAVLSSMKHAWSEMGVFRGTQTLLHLNQKGGFDCPSCAWPDPDDHRAVAEFCENGAKAVADEATLKRITPEFFLQNSIQALQQFSDLELGKSGRLTQPMWLPQDSQHYQPISWEAAFELIGKELNALASPDEAIFYTSGRTSNEAAFMYQLFVRQFGTNNMPDCSNMCHESSGTALSETVGIGKGTVTLQDFDLADVIMVMGQNPGTNHPRMLTALQKARRNGAKVISINPLPETGLRRFTHPQEIAAMLLNNSTPLTDLFLQVRINGDIALLKGIMKELLAMEEKQPGMVLDQEFIQQATVGYEELEKNIKEASWEEIIQYSGLTREQIRKAAQLLAGARKIIVCWAMGLTQHKAAVSTIQEVVNLILLKGSIGKPGAGLCPVRGHSNVQGDRTMGIWEKPKPAFLQKLGERFQFTPPYHHGYDTVEAIRAMHEGKAKVFIAMGGNFLSATPDTEYTAKALQQCKLTVHVSTKLNRSHLITGKQALILPCLGRTEIDIQQSGEQLVSVENSMGVVHSSKGVLAPASEHLLSEPAIVAGMALATLGEKTSANWVDMVQNYDTIREHIEAVIPGFTHYNLQVREPGGFYLPNGPRVGNFDTTSGKAHFTSHAIARIDLKEDELIMMTVRSHDQYNTTIYGLDDRYRGIYNERRVVLLNQQDIEQRGLAAGQLVDLQSHYDGEKRVAEGFIVVPFSIPQNCAATYFPEANVLVPISQVAEKSNTPVSKSVVITLHAVHKV